MNQDNSAIESSQQEFSLLKEKVLKLMERHDAILNLFHEYRFELSKSPTGQEFLKKYVEIMKS